MKYLRLGIIAFLLPLLVKAQQTVSPQNFVETGATNTLRFSKEGLNRIDQWVQQFIDSGNVPNAVIFVAQKGNVVYHKAFGYSNIEKKRRAANTDIFRIASQTKAIASVALMTFFEEGKFLLDEPVSKYIPAFKNPVVLVSYDTLHPATGKYTTRPAASEITIRQLLSHTAGIPYGHPLDARAEFKVPYLNSMNPDKLEDVINRLAKRPLIADPGKGFIYGLNTDVIGRLVEVIAGKPLDVVIKERVTGPLGMNDTYFYLPNEKKERLVELYSKEKKNDPITVSANDTFRLYPVAGAQTYFTAGAGMVSTALDYAKFCQMLLNGGTFNNNRVLGKSTIELMTQNHIGNLEVWDRKDKFGLGFEIISDASTYADLASPGSFGWGGAYCSDYLIDPKEEIVLQLFTNILPYAYGSEFNRKLKILIYEALK
ncbi:MAG TPA: serine hydrolase domain-containing protein [Chitinophagaceae bacterium]|nr:serine hydrolase domain-containing protein [Chitinophagaceae bacterium]